VADIERERDEATEAALAVAARHALHDEELIAALAVAGIDDEAELARARSLVERCVTCRDLHADLEAISGALRVELRGTVAAPRDFRLSTDDARRLGGTISPRGFLRNLRRGLVSFGRPLGASMAALGIVGVLVGSLSFVGGPASAPTVGGDSNGPGAAASDGKLQELDNSSTFGPASSYVAVSGPVASDRESAKAVESARDLGAGSGRSAAPVLLAGSVGLVVAGLAVALYASRRTDRKRLDPSQFH
jgi:hypothetical protein